MFTTQVVARPPGPACLRALVSLALLATGCAGLQGGALEDYVQRPDTNYVWRQLETRPSGGFSITRLELTSQSWRGHLWTHQVQVVRPRQVSHPGVGFLFITGDGTGTGSLGMARTLAERGGAVVAVLTCVPNQPLYDGRREDALIAYTFDHYLQSGDETWPLLLPMTKSAVRALDAVQAWAQAEHQQQIGKFVVSGASKRGWTTWLTGAVDPRVCGIAPMVIDMLNMKAQTDWARKVYGRQSERIHDYTDLALIEKMDSAPMIRLRETVDPYSYRQRYTMAKLILLGTNDPYWTVDALRHYWDDLPGPKLVFQTPNTGHNLGRDALQTTAAFFQMIAEGQDLPRMEWQMQGAGQPGVTVKLSRPARKALLWTAASPTRDFRQAQWSGAELPLPPEATQVSAQVTPPASGYRAFLAEVTFATATGQDYRLSTQVQVTPDDIK